MKSYLNDMFELPQVNNLVIHIDMNSYFASCEQQANPAWRGRPLGVCSYLHPKGTIIAASKEAKLLGIGTGTKVQEARQLCPNIVLVADSPTRYRVISDRIQSIFAEYTPDIENYSVDESFLRFDANELSAAAAELMAREIKKRIKQEVGDWLTCSVGIGRTKFFAKIGSDFKKPDGLTVIDNHNLDVVLGKLELTDIWGISFGLKRQLNQIGIYTPLEIKYAKPSLLMKKMGKMGYFLWSRLNGLEVDRLRTEDDVKRGAKSVGHSYTLIKKTADKDQLALLLMKLAEKVGRRLRRKNKRARVCWIGWKYVYGGGFARQQKLPEAVDDGWDIFKYTYALLAAKPLHDKVSKFYVSVSGLENSKQIQLSFFDDKLKKKRLVRSLDKINDKYGEMTVARGMYKNWTDDIRDRVAFGHKP